MRGGTFYNISVMIQSEAEREELMNERTLKTVRNMLTLPTIISLSSLPASGVLMPSASDYQMVYSVVDSGGGARLNSVGGGNYFVEAAIGQTILPQNLGITNGGDYVNRTGFYNPPHFTFQRVLASTLTFISPLNSSQANVRLSIPAYAVDSNDPGIPEKNVFDITINKDPVNSPVIADPQKIAEADDKIVHNQGDWSRTFGDSLSEISIFDEQSYYTSTLAEPGTLSLAYNDVNNDGIVDGSNPMVRTESLIPWGLDETLGSWAHMPNANLDKYSKTLTFNFGMPGVYALLGVLDQTFNPELKAYPVPFRPYGPHAGNGIGQTGTESAGITFENVPQAGKIEIYTLDGRLVNKINIPDNLSCSGGHCYQVNWNVRTESGERAASGVYIWRVVAGGKSKFGKLMVIW